MSRRNGRDEKRNQILQALDRCLQEKPFDQTSIKDIARAAGVNHGLLHYYFKNKEDILISYIDFTINHYRALSDGWSSDIETNTIDEKAFIQEFFNFMNKRITLNRSLSKVFVEIWEIAAYNPTVKAKLQQAYTEWTTVLTDILGRSIKDRTSARRISTALVAFHEGVSLFSVLWEPEDTDFEAVLAVFQKQIIEMV